MPGLIDMLCLQCGLCCNGVIFADVRRERGDVSPLFKQHVLRVSQPCPAFNAANCRCAVYAERPVRCRKFECKQLIAVQAGKTTSGVALKKIREVQALVKAGEDILAVLGHNRLDLPFNKRFQECQAAAEKEKIAPEDLHRLADLQLTVHRMNALLARNFYA